MRNKRGCVVSTTTATPAPTWILSSWAFDRLRRGDLTAIQYIGFAATERGSASTTTTTTATATHQQHQHRQPSPQPAAAAAAAYCNFNSSSHNHTRKPKLLRCGFVCHCCLVLLYSLLPLLALVSS